MSAVPLSETSSFPASSHTPTGKMILRISLLTLALGAAALLGHFLRKDVPFLEQWIKEQGYLAPLIFTSAFCLLPAIFFSTDVLCFTAGALFGFWAGLIYAFSGMLASAALMFVVARYLFRKPIQKIFLRYRRFRAINQVLSGQNKRLLWLLRIAPIPFAPLNYLMGVSNLPFKTYAITVFGTSLTIIAGVYYGYVAKHITKLVGHTERFPVSHEVLRFIGLALILLILIVFSRLAHRELKKFSVE